MGHVVVQDITKRIVTLSVPNELAVLVRRRFARPSDTSMADPFLRALEERAKGQRLTVSDYAEIEAEQQRNRARNEANKERYAREHGVRPS